ncbi:MFS transporter [Candidatus Woesearchaeota archaeon]|nr:MFS transporter [Candidatus Woesearchaeota archaeon]
MSHHSHHLLHKFFVEKEINQLYTSVFLMTIAQNLISFFVPIYLYQNGYSITKIILFFFLISLSFVIFSLFSARIVTNIGIKHAIFISVPFLVFYYIGLQLLPSIKALFFVLPTIKAFRMMFYNYGFHLNYIEHSNAKKRGTELSIIGILSIIGTVIAPAIAGIIIGLKSYDALFIIAIIILFFSVIPLFFSPDIKESTMLNYKLAKQYLTNKQNITNFLSFSGYAVESIIGRILWPIFLIILFLTTQKVGFVVTVTISVSLMIVYFIGKISDKQKNKKKLLRFATTLYFFAWIGRVFANNAFRVILVDSYKNFSEKILHLPWSAQSYDDATKENYYTFIVIREIIFNLSRIIFLPFIMLVFFIDFYPFTISFIIAATFSLLYPFLKC